MAKGRKLTVSRIERLLGSYSYSPSQGSNGSDSSELGEEDVWSVVDNMGNNGSEELSYDNSHNARRASPAESNGSSISNPNQQNRRRSVPQDDHDRQVGGLSLAFEESWGSRTTSSPRIVHQFHGSMMSPRGRQMATSTPVNVPDWSKILRVDTVDSLHGLNSGFNEGDSELIPPHEYLARSRKSTATSIFEGVGRTLKGRDMSRVREAVWSQTGFDG